MFSREYTGANLYYTSLQLSPSFTSSHMFCSVKGTKEKMPTPTQNKNYTPMHDAWDLA